MRPAELALLAMVLVGTVRPVTRAARAPAVAVLVAVVTLLVAAGHVFAEGARWQLTSLYLAGVVVVLAAAGDVARTPDPRSGRGGWALVGLLAILGGTLGWALPIPTLPAPSGPRPVGTSVVELVDEQRLDRYGPNPTAPRRLVLQVWYPADIDAPVRPGPLIPAGASFGRHAASWLGFPPFTLDHVGLVRSHATADVPPTPEAGALQVVVYAHGWGGFRTIQSDLAESLASHGYVVAALDHTHGSVATSFPDGRVVPIDESALPDGVASDVYDAASERLVETFTQDLAFLLDELAEGAVPALTGRLDLDAVGVVGHSTGGGAAVRLCAEDRRCAAVVGFDPWVEPVPDVVVGDGLTVPFLALRSEEWVGNDNDARLRRLRASSTGPAALVSVAGTAHRDVTLLPFMSPLAARLGLAGPTDGARTHDIAETWTRGWLDHHLRGAVRDPLVQPPEFDESIVDG
ncbi:alpha/beta hydrolase family protein [Nitriliruptor alkaliphilus]|uniref:alpha/beta hydrolase family protein n=1 Tax=Nitriliruptor alkaliphilus TaxID=427918 RepID=UPI000695D212|nr:dienelactone hydrolase family protein [Nitriliruptor alkaliphilus]